MVQKLSVPIVQMTLYNASVLFQFAGQWGTLLQFQEVVTKALIFGKQEGEGPSTSGSETSLIVSGQIANHTTHLYIMN